MSEKRVNLTDIVEGQFPDYVRSEYPLVTEFTKQYYESQENKGAPVDLLTNIDQYINLDIAVENMISDITRKISEQGKNTYHHLGIYCYTFDTLKKFVSFPQSPNEQKNKLEQLRALDNNIKINVALAKSSPIGLDTEEDLVAIKKIMEYKSK